MVAAVFKDVLSHEESLESLELMNFHRQQKRVWNKGCEADVLPSTVMYQSQLNCHVALKSAGLCDSNVQEIHDIATGPDGKGYPRVHYTNKKGQQKTWPLCSVLKRQSYSTIIQELKNKADAELSILDTATEEYIKFLPQWLESRGYDPEVCLKSLQEQNPLKVSTLIVDNHSPIGTHRDPPCPILLWHCLAILPIFFG